MTAACRAVLVCALCAAACSDEGEPTEVIVEIHAEARVDEESDGLRLHVQSVGDPGSSDEPKLHPAVRFPFILALTPRHGDATRKYRVTAEAVDADGDTVAAARLVSGFVAGERRRVRMVIEDACIDGPVCDEDETCHVPRGTAADDSAVCVDARVDAEDFGRGGQAADLGELLDRASPGDAGVDDAGADGAAQDAGGDGGGPEDPCATDNGDCDPLSECTLARQGVACGPCPDGFAGDGKLGCEPRLLDLTVSPDELTPAFAPEVMNYAAFVPLPIERIAITASAPEEATLSIAGRTAISGRAVMSDVLMVGDTEIPIELATTAGARAPYALVVARGAQRAYVKAHNTGGADHFGGAVAISGDTMVIGAADEDSAGVDMPQDDSLMDSGAAYVFVRQGGVFSHHAYLKADNADVKDNFGYAVAISGDTIVVGAPLEDSAALGVGDEGALDDGAIDSGAAYVFVRAGDAWSQQAYLKADNTRNYDLFGWSVAIAGDTIVVGAMFESSNATQVDGNGDNALAPGSGAAYVFVREGGVWSQQAYLKPLNNGSEHGFGSSVAVASDAATVAVGAPGARDDDERGRGAAYVFTRADTTWMQAAQLKAGAPNPGEAFGVSVAIAQNTLVVGTSSGDPDAAQNGAGAVHVFERADGFATAQRLLVDHLDPGDDFGRAVAIDHDLLLVGAPGEAGGLLGVHATALRADNAASASGAAYVFARDDDGWTALAYLKASNAESADRFGTAVALSDGSLVIGSIHESSSATDVSAGASTAADNAAPSSGAAYVFQ